MKIEIESLTKEYGATSALRGIDLSIPSGALAVIVGPSGSGKSTLLNLVAGLLEPTSGKIRFDDRDVTSLAPEKRNIGFVFQSYALFPHLSVEGNIGFGIEGCTRAEKTARVAALLDRFGLAPLAQRMPREISGGERQRTALARAMARQPELLLLDEPLSALDAQMRERLRHHLSQSLRDYGRTAIHVTHDRQEAMALADVLVVMREGKIEQTGAAFDLYRRPANEFVAQFLGEATLVPVDVENAFVRTPWGSFRSAEGKSGQFSLVIRPEDFQLSRGSGEIRVHVRTSIYMGSHWRIEGVDQHGLALKADVPSEARPGHGEVVELSLNLASAHFVNDSDAFTGERINDDRSVARG